MEGQSNETKKIVKIFRGTLVHCLGLKDDDFQIFEDALLAVNAEGNIAFVGSGSDIDALSSQYNFDQESVINLGKKFIIPGLVDTHLHAPQYAFTGTGTDLPLLEWLERYTFPVEAKYESKDFANEVFNKAVKRTLSYGTTTACYFSTIHLEATKILVDIIEKLGQRAYVGKVCMDRNSPKNYIENTEDSLKSTESFIQHVLNKVSSPLVTPVITPRFVPTCSAQLMEGLGQLAQKYDIPIQSHISENKGEVGWVKELHPELQSYSEVYDTYGLLNEKTIMAHGIYLSDGELELFSKKCAGICHCPVSNYSLSSGVLNVRRAMKAGVKVGLGTDVSGGYSPSLLEVIRQAIIASNSLTFHPNSHESSDAQYSPLTYREMFALATVGGSQVLGLESRIGNFVPGKSFDACIIDPFAKDSPFDIFEIDSVSDVFQKFVFLGDDRNLESVFVQGKQVAGTSLLSK